MTVTPLPELATTLHALGAAVRAEGAAIEARWASWIERPAFAESAANLACYQALRRRDLRPLQRSLMAYGLSSLGRLEGRVLANIDAVAWALDRLCGLGDARPVPPERFFRGNALLSQNSDAVLGPARQGREARIVVTLASSAATGGPGPLRALIEAGADVFRINCAHDDAAAWRAMAANARAAAEAAGRPARILMDLAGPKSRTGQVFLSGAKAHLSLGDRLALHTPANPAQACPSVECQLPAVLDHLREGHRVFIDDGKIAARVEHVAGGMATLVIERTGPKGGKLKPEKGLNFPDTVLPIPALTEKDLADLPHVAALADMIGYSFVQSAADIQALQSELARLRPDDWRKLAIVAKIETPRAVANLPEIIVAAAGRQPMGVMIARGDLAVELGFERLAEMQEEIMWFAEAAHVPVIWATQVLESLVKKGLPSRGEMTDAAMSVRAEAVMLNKGPYIEEGVAVLDRLLGRMHAHQDKKTPKLRALRSW